jgi:hypothetical protein
MPPTKSRIAAKPAKAFLDLNLEKKRVFPFFFFFFGNGFLLFGFTFF